MDVSEQRNAIRTTVDIRSEARQRIFPAGTFGVIVERYTEPEGYAVDLGIPSKEFVGGYEWDNLILYPHQFVYVDEFPKSPYDDDRPEPSSG
jgi:hypothetical protein